jgi:N-glycosylase/DNA lyase
MSKQIYDETQAFLEDKWGPLGGWAQAVMFAADLKVTKTPKTTPVKQRPSSIIKTDPFLATISPADSCTSHPDTLDASPLKRKSAPTEFKRTRSATRLSIQRTDSARLIDKVEDLQV